MRTVLSAGHAGWELEGLHAMLAQAGAAAGIDARSEELADGPLRAQLAAGALLVLAYVAPAVSVGTALKAAAGCAAPAVAELLARWRAGGELMLALAVRHPTQCLLVNAEAALATPARLVAEAGQALSLALTPLDMAAAPPPATALSPLEALLAGAMVAADREADALFIELESSAHLAYNQASAGEHLAVQAWAEYQATLASAADWAARAGRAEADKASAIVDAQAQLERLSAEHEGMTRERDEAIANAEVHATLLTARFEERLASLESERNRHAALAIKAAEVADANEAELARQTAHAQHLQREGEALLIQLHDAHLESESYCDQADEARNDANAAREDADAARHEVAAARDEAAAARKEALAARQEAQVTRLVAAGVSEDAEGLRSALAAAREGAAAQKVQLLVHAGALQQAQEALAKLEAEHAETMARLASLQAETADHLQTRQELDRARLQLLELNAGTLSLQEGWQLDANRLAESERARTRLQSFWHDHQPNPVCVDLRQPVDGENWYAAEADGRWTGPARHSTLKVPALKQGRYSIEITMAGAITREIAAGLRVELHGRPLDMNFNRIKHPRVATATFDAPPPNDAAVWLLGFQVPAVESPSDRNSTDRRLLGVRVTEVKFIGETVKG